MAEQSDERRGTAEICQNLLSLIARDVDPELVQLVLDRTLSSSSSDRADHDGQRGAGGEHETALLRELMELLSLVRDAGIDRAQLSALLKLSSEPLPTGDDNPHAPKQ